MWEAKEDPDGSGQEGNRVSKERRIAGWVEAMLSFQREEQRRVQEGEPSW